MVLTFSTNGNQLYVDSENIAIATEEEYTDEKTKETVKFTRVYLKGIEFPEEIPNWVDVKESAKVIANRMKTNKRKEGNSL